MWAGAKVCGRRTSDANYSKSEAQDNAREDVIMVDTCEDL